VTVAVVTGGASGFGAAIGAECAARGIDVALLDRDEAGARAVAARLAATGVRTIARVTDVADAASVEMAAATVESALGGADLVFSNVGVQLFGSLEAMTDDEWRWVLDVNVVGSARVARTFVPLLARSADPHLVFTASTSVLEPASRLGAYQASKFAVWGLAETLRLELADRDIAVSVVFPSGMTTTHLESSAAAQPDHLRRPVVTDDDLVAMMASAPTMAAALLGAEEAASGIVDAVLAGERYVVSHGDLRAAVDERSAGLRQAAVAAVERHPA
jgi:NAD(P)-dependent dehydrogenase (short-subunit alcohol dehydrogenase family)